MEKLPIGTVTEANTVYIASLDRKFTFDGGIMCEKCSCRDSNSIKYLTYVVQRPLLINYQRKLLNG